MIIAPDTQLDETIIHPTAIVSPDVKIGNGCWIGPYAIIDGNVTLGKNNWVGPHAVISGNVSIGDKNHFYQGCSIGAQPQDHKWQGEDTNVMIGNHNVFRENVSVHRGTQKGGGTTQIGDHNFFMVHAHIAHDCTLGSHITFANCATLSGHVTIEDMVTLSGLTAVHQFCRIGKLAFAAGGAMITQDIPPYVIAQGDRARIVGLNSVGLRRQGVKTPLVTELRKAYREFWRNTSPLKDRLTMLEENFPENPLVTDMIGFIATNKRGIIGPRKGGKSLSDD